MFDKNLNNVIELEDTVSAFKKFIDYIAEHKVKIFFSFCDEDKSGFLNEAKILRFLSNCLKHEHDRIVLSNNV